MATVMWDLDGCPSVWFGNFYPWLCNVEGFAPLPGWTEAEGHKGVYWHFYRSHGLTDEQFVARLTQYAEEGGFGEQKCLPGAREAAQRIKAAGHSQHAVSDRPAAALADTEWWIDTYLPEIDTLTISRDKTVFKTYGPPRYFAIDDRIENVANMRAADIDAYLLTRPWNETADLPRIESFEEFADIVVSTA